MDKIIKKCFKEIYKEWLDTIGIENYIINKDLTVDVDGDVDLYHINLKSIPVQFGIVKGDFNISFNPLLNSLEGSPRKCKKFNCCGCNITALGFAPMKCITFDCSHNPNLFYYYLNTFNFNFIKKKLITNYGDINNKWNKNK